MYNGAVLNGGKQLEKALQQIVKRAKKGGVVKVGFLEGATYTDGKKVASIAAKQEFGDPQNKLNGKPAPIPPRPFFREAIAKNSPEWGVLLGSIVKAYEYDVEKSLLTMGNKIKKQIIESIDTGKFAPLSRYTILKKGHAKPLIDSATMYRSVDYELENEPS